MLEYASKESIIKIKNKILQQVERSNNGCLEWIGRTKTKEGYGYITFLGTRMRVSRLVLEMSLGRSLKPGMICCHKCDNPSCCEPSHLYEGSYSDNNSDRAIRNPNNQGGGNLKLTQQQADEIRNLYNSGTHWKIICMLYGISNGTLYGIIRGDRY